MSVSLSFASKFKAELAAGERAPGLHPPIKQRSLGLFTARWYAADNSTSHSGPLMPHFLPEHTSAASDVLTLQANANTDHYVTLLYIWNAYGLMLNTLT